MDSTAELPVGMALASLDGELLSPRHCGKHLIYIKPSDYTVCASGETEAQRGNKTKVAEQVSSGAGVRLRFTCTKGSRTYDFMMAARFNVKRPVRTAIPPVPEKTDQGRAAGAPVPRAGPRSVL